MSKTKGEIIVGITERSILEFLRILWNYCVIPGISMEFWDSIGIILGLLHNEKF
jgi:hypothetical protein